MGYTFSKPHIDFNLRNPHSICEIRDDKNTAIRAMLFN